MRIARAIECDGGHGENCDALQALLNEQLSALAGDSPAHGLLEQARAARCIDDRNRIVPNPAAVHEALEPLRRTDARVRPSGRYPVRFVIGTP